MNRRGFLKTMGAGLLIPAAPAIVKAENIMRVNPIVTMSQTPGHNPWIVYDQFRECLADAIYAVDPTDTPFMVSFNTLSSDTHEWVTYASG